MKQYELSLSSPYGGDSPFLKARARDAALLEVPGGGGGHYNLEAEAYDRHRTQVLEHYGLKVLRFCNTDIDKNFYSVCTVIEDELKKRI